MNKYLVWLFTGATSILMSACYGPSNRYYMKPIKVNAVDSSNQSISGLIIKAQCENISYNSDDYGTIMFPVKEHENLELCKIEIKDVDGEENGGKFKTTSTTMKNGQQDYTLKLEKE